MRKKTKQNAPVSEETARTSDLKPHPKNYRAHPESQIDHIVASIRRHGFYRRVVIANDDVILAGHGVVAAARKMGLEEVPVFRVPLSSGSPEALKILVADNELGKFADSDDRMLTEILRGLKEDDEQSLLGTGYDDQMLAGLLMVTRPASEIASIDEASEWVGMPEYDEGEAQLKLVVTFASEEDREEFVRKAGLRIAKKVHGTWGARWPPVGNEDVGGLRFES